MENNMTTATTTTATKPRRQPVPLNGVDTPTLFGTLDVVKGQPALARFQFRARNRWQDGTLSETTIDTFSGAGGEHAHKSTLTLYADHPTVLVGEDRAPLPIEFLLHALASCITGGIANIAAARGVKLTEVESRPGASTCSASGSRRTFATATRASARASPSKATHRRRSCRRSSSSRARALRCSTS